MRPKTDPERRRREAIRNGQPIDTPKPTSSYRWAVRFVKNDGSIVTRPFATEGSARRFASRLKTYGRPGVAVFVDQAAKARWREVA